MGMEVYTRMRKKGKMELPPYPNIAYKKVEHG